LQFVLREISNSGQTTASDLTPYFSTTDSLNFVGSGVPTRVRFA
jgi:hypothetical protein